MATSPAPPEAEGAGSPGPDRAGFPSSRRRISRWVIRVLLLAVALLAFSTPAFAATHAVHAPHAPRATAGRAAATARAGTAGRAELTASLTPAVPGGVCQVPGIGDIGGLVGLCTQGSSGIVGDLNNICEPSLPQPEQATGGIDAMVEPPSAAAGGKTLYDNYGVAGQFWAAHGLQCSDMTSLIGNNVAGMVFDAAKSVDRVTITVYQSAAGNNILTWLQNAVDGLISALGKAIYFPYLAPVVILGAIWLAWQGLIRKRATRTIEGTLWMVVACVAAIALIGRPAMFTGVGTSVSNGVTEVLNTAFSKLPAPAGSNCLPVQQGDPQSVTGNYAFTSGNGLVDENANELWSVLVCKPWLYGELGTTTYNPAGQPPTVVNTYGRQLLWAQAIAANETPSAALIQAKQATYTGIATSMQQNDPAIYPLFQGNQWTTRLEISFAAMFAALVAGLLILLIALTLIVLKLGFLLLLVAGPFFLIIGTHPGFGRVIAIRWFEMLVGVLMKQVAIAVVLSVLLYCYSLIMGTADTVLPWALKILMISLVTVAVFIYRKPFAHLFSAVGYGTIGSTDRAEYSLREAGATFRRSTLDAATVAVPGMAGYRAARWARRNPGQAAAVAAGAAAGVAAGGAAAGGAAAGDAAAGAGAAQAGSGDGYASRLRPDAPPPADEDGEVSSGSRRAGGGVGGGVSGAGPARARNVTEADGASGRVAPPLDLPPRTARTPATAGTSSAPSGPAGSSGAATGWSRGAGHSAGTGAQARATASGSRAGSAPPVRGQARSGSRGSAPPANGNGNGTRNGNGRASGSGPAWPGSGWPTAGARQRPGSGPRPNPTTPPPAEPAGQGGPLSSSGTDEPRAMPFWLRPIRRDK
jgi:TrbL/VirB6 plasmid conjugal transfer protein